MRTLIVLGLKWYEGTFRKEFFFFFWKRYEKEDENQPSNAHHELSIFLAWVEEVHFSGRNANPW